ncbi:hypothetical protein [Delftia tsuruhatensis]|uniref:hypothetical protein n=1 Tax=Delftia tsuruhatensis TaxID=180282 RepID=UPI00128B975A|nr:hypothetical protein [Delftia tsuruhatensis]
MSINSITNSAATRRSDMIAVGMVQTSLRDISCAFQTRVTDMVPPAAHEKVPATRKIDTVAKSPISGVDTALHVIFGFIRTEILTLYVAVLSALQTLDQVSPADWYKFYLFLALTPAVGWLIFAPKLKAARKVLSIAVGSCPIWEMSAACIAFAIWAFALPHSPFSTFPLYSPATSGALPFSD